MNPRRLLAPVSLLLFLAMTTAPHAAERSIDKEVLVDATVDQVWDAWTTREGITSFLAPEAEIEARVDGAFHIFIDPYAAPGMKGADTMRFLALQPKTMLSFDWNAPPSLPTIRQQRTVVIVRFHPSGSQTRVTLHQVGWGDLDGLDGKEWDATYRYFDQAWGFVLGNLRRRFADGGKPTDWTEWRERMKKEHEAK